MAGYLFITILMAVALGMDAFTVAVIYGMDGTVQTLGQRLKTALIFGFFQGLLFSVGIVLYQILSGEMTKYNSMIAGIILLMMGGHNLIDGLQPNPAMERKSFSLWLLCLLGVATSIDALAAGITFNLIYDNLKTAIVIVGSVGVLLTYLGAAFGSKFGYRIGNKANVIGGLVIIALGIKSLFF